MRRSLRIDGWRRTGKAGVGGLEGGGAAGLLVIITVLFVSL